MPRIAQISLVSKALQGRDPSLIHQLFDSLVISLFDFSAVCFMGAAGCQLAKIEKLQLVALKRFAGLTRKTSNDLTMTHTQAKPIIQTLQERALNTFNRINTTCPVIDNIQKQAIELRNSRTHLSPFDFFLSIGGKKLSVTSCHSCIFGARHSENSKCATHLANRSRGCSSSD